MAATVNVRVDEETKRAVEALFSNLGMNISTAVNMFFKQALMEEALPFHPKVKRGHIPLKERLKNDAGGYKAEEWDTGSPVGREVL